MPAIEQLKVKAHLHGEGAFATSQHDWPKEQVALVHQARSKRLGSEVSSAYRQVVRFASLHPSNRLDIELPLKAGPIA
jgi:hypothetical protein